MWIQIDKFTKPLNFLSEYLSHDFQEELRGDKSSSPIEYEGVTVEN